MQLAPRLILTEADMKPFIDAYKQAIKDTSERPYKLVSVIPVATGDGTWLIELAIDPMPIIDTVPAETR